MKVISFNGQCANGKDVAADYLAVKLKDHYKSDWRRCAFGDNVKRVYMEAFGVDREFVELWKRQDAPPPGFEKNVRQSLQFIGDGFRQMKPSVWIDWIFRDINGDNGMDTIISDGRYYSECDAVKVHGGVNVGVWRPGFENDIEHPSESQLKPEIDKLKKHQESGRVTLENCPFDWFLVNDGSKEDLYQKIDEGLIPYVIMRFAQSS